MRGRTESSPDSESIAVPGLSIWTTDFEAALLSYEISNLERCATEPPRVMVSFLLPSLKSFLTWKTRDSRIDFYKSCARGFERSSTWSMDSIHHERSAGSLECSKLTICSSHSQELLSWIVTVEVHYAKSCLRVLLRSLPFACHCSCEADKPRITELVFGKIRSVLLNIGQMEMRRDIPLAGKSPSNLLRKTSVCRIRFSPGLAESPRASVDLQEARYIADYDVLDVPVRQPSLGPGMCGKAGADSWTGNVEK